MEQDKRIAFIEKHDDGVWVLGLITGWQVRGKHYLQSPTKKRLLARLADLQPCVCKRCKREKELESCTEGPQELKDLLKF